MVARQAAQGPPNEQEGRPADRDHRNSSRGGNRTSPGRGERSDQWEQTEGPWLRIDRKPDDGAESEGTAPGQAVDGHRSAHHDEHVVEMGVEDGLRTSGENPARSLGQPEQQGERESHDDRQHQTPAVSAQPGERRRHQQGNRSNLRGRIRRVHAEVPTTSHDA